MEKNTEIDNEIEFHAHCDHENCSMGSAEFTCPICKTWNVEYGNLWYEHEEYPCKDIPVECSKCGTQLTAYYEDGWKIKGTQ